MCSPLGILYQPFVQLSKLAKAMYDDLESNYVEHGFLGYSEYHSNSHLTKGVLLNIIYFRSAEQ